MDKDATAVVPIRRRKCGSKTRTGCQTCKIRRVKCDETKPSCERCTKTGRKCDGYPASSSLSPSSQAGDPSDTILCMSNDFPGTRQEKRSFQYFITNTVPELTGYFTSSFWEQLILQASTSEPSLRHAIIAIGSLHEDFSRHTIEDPIDGRARSISPLGLSSGSNPRQPDQETRRRQVQARTQKQKLMEFAIKQYSKAISHLRQSLSAGKQSPITALMSCLLFVCFDSLRGNLEASMVHLQSGLRILRDVQTRQRSRDVGEKGELKGIGTNTEEAYMIKKDVKPMFARLTNQAILYVDTRNAQDRERFGRELVIESEEEEREIMAFETLEAAREGLNLALGELMRMFWLCDSDLPLSAQSPRIHAMYDRSSHFINAWSQSFIAFMAVHSASLSPRQIRGAALLKIHHVTALVMHQACPTSTSDPPVSIARHMNTESTFAPFTEHFRTIINLSRSLVGTQEHELQKQTPSAPKGTFSTDLGLIGPLYYLCVKCLDQDIREEGLVLLRKWRRKEGMWDSEMVDGLVRGFWEIKKWYEGAKEDKEEMVRVLGREKDIQEVCELVDLGDGQWEWRLNLHDDGMRGADNVRRMEDLSVFEDMDFTTERNADSCGSGGEGMWDAYTPPL